MYNKNKLDKILGGLVGVACGDSLGATLEFLPPRSTKEPLTEIIGGGAFRTKPGAPTDDTMCTIAVARGILTDYADPIKYIGDELMKWYNSNPPDVGTTMRTVFNYYRRTKSWRKAYNLASYDLKGRMDGNGSLMRCVPVALFYDHYPTMIQIMTQQNNLTHGSRSDTTCKYYGSLIHSMLANHFLKDTYMLQNEGIYQEKYEDLNPTGYVVDSFNCAMWCFLHTNNFEDAVVKAVNLCGDADTIGAITGGLAGAYYGYSDIPTRWKEKLTTLGELHEIANKFVNWE